MNIDYDISQRVATITLNRPDKMNALLPDMLDRLFELVAQASADPDVRAIVLTGHGRAFCAGIDLSPSAGWMALDTPVPGTPELGKLAEPQWGDDIGTALSPRFSQGWSSLIRSRKPLIAAINGPAYGWGAILALHCDIRFMSQSALLNFTFARLAVPAEKASAWLLTRLVGASRAFDLLYTTRNIDAQECKHIGLALDTVDDSALLSRAQAYAEQLAEQSAPRSLAAIKSQVWSALDQSYDEAYLEADAEQLRCMGTRDFAAALQGFATRRPPTFEGR